ncbi:MAG: type IX secretion system membrane protein PorP/SprF [Bacteroidota bacterium]
MKHLNKLVLTLIGGLGLLCSSIQAQELRYTLYDMSHLVTNPANTGAFLGTVRLSGIARSQWSTYQTPSFSADAPIILIGKKKRDWLGLGLMLVNDVSGENKLTRTHTGISAAYHKVLDKKSKNILTFGLQYTSVATALADNNLLGFTPITPSMAQENIESPIPDLQQRYNSDFRRIYLADSQNNPSAGGGNSVSITDILNRTERLPANTATRLNFGVRLSAELSDEASMVIGAAVYNSFRFSLNLGGGGGNSAQNDNSYQGVLLPSAARNIRQDTMGKLYKVPMDARLHATLNYELNDRFRLRPSMFLHAQGPLRETILQTRVGYYATDNKDTVISGGLGYRFGEAIQLLAGLEYKDWMIAAAYDYNTNPLGDTAGRYRSGFEVAASYIIKIYQKPQADPAILCPKL